MNRLRNWSSLISNPRSSLNVNILPGTLEQSWRTKRKSLLPNVRQIWLRIQIQFFMKSVNAFWITTVSVYEDNDGVFFKSNFDFIQTLFITQLKENSSFSTRWNSTKNNFILIFDIRMLISEYLSIFEWMEIIFARLELCLGSRGLNYDKTNKGRNVNFYIEWDRINTSADEIGKNIIFT